MNRESTTVQSKWVLCVSIATVFPCALDAAEFSLVPVSASGASTIVGNQVTLSGGGQRVFLEIQLSGWSPSRLKAWQIAIDGAGYTSGLLGVVTPATQACAGDADCVTAFGGGATCTVPVFNPNRCTPGFIDVSRTDYVFASATDLAAVDISTLNYRYGSTLLFGDVVDPGSARYGGTLVVDVPVGAIGTFTIGFPVPVCSGGGNNGLPCDLGDPTTCPDGLCQSDNFMQDANNNQIIPLTLTPAVIVVACQNQADCDDGNACTDDSCEPDGTCSNIDNFNAAIECCNPADGIKNPLDDGNECTDDVCDPLTGIVSHPNVVAGAVCGDPAESECDHFDTCDGAGICEDNVESNGVPCGDGIDDDCTNPDTCNGAGECSANDELAGTLCGDPVNNDCTDPDSCDGAGQCERNDAGDGTPCDDLQFCNIGESCSGGLCSGGASRDCSDGVPCTTDSCNELTDSCENDLDAGFCLILNTCRSNGELNPANDCQACDTLSNTSDWSFLDAGVECDDGDACTGTGREGIGVDTCNGTGICAGVLDPQCNDECSFAVEVTEGTTTGNNDNRGPDDTEALCQPESDNDVWFVYTATCNGAVFISTTGSQFTPSNDTVLSVYDGCPLDGGTEIACDDDSGVDLQSALTLFTLSGVTYWIRVAGFEDNSGDLVLNIEVFDDCLIDGVCYPDGALNPNNDCESCRSQLSATSWSFRQEGIACGDATDTECDSPDACDGAGTCELNPKPDGTACSDDGNECTFDVCGSAVCIHPPRPAGTACGDPTITECDTPDSCNGEDLCLPNYEPSGTPCGDPSETTCDLHDVCTGDCVCDANLAPNGTPCDDTDICTGEDICQTGECVGTAIPQAPLVVSAGPRHLTVTPLPSASAAPVSLLLTSPDWPCLSKYVTGGGQLVDGPIVLLPDDWGTVLVRSPDVVPNSTYVVVAECAAFVSASGSAATAIFGDIVGPFDGSAWGLPDGRIDINDLSAIVEAFAHLPTAPPTERADLHGCRPNGIIDVLDMTSVVDGFSGFSYAVSTGCPVPCP